MSEDREKKKSKYLRNASTPVSKYIRQKGEKPKSKYLRSAQDEHTEEDGYEEEYDSEPEDGYRASVITPKRARELYYSEEIPDEAEETPEISPAADEEDYIPNEHITSKGSAVDIFKEGEINEEQKQFYRREEAKKTLKHEKSQAYIRMSICLVLLAMFASVLQFLPFHVPYTPSIFTVEFSALPELIAAIAYGPIFGVVVCIIKNLIHISIYQNYIISDFNNILLNSTFVFIAGLIYSRSMFSGDKKINHNSKTSRRTRIFKSGIAGALVSAVPQLLITRFIAYPLLEKFYSDRGFTMTNLLSSYQECYIEIKSHLPQWISSILPDITGMLKAIAIFNLPITFVKLLIVTTITALIYKHISPFLHYRAKDNKNRKAKK